MASTIAVSAAAMLACPHRMPAWCTSAGVTGSANVTLTVAAGPGISGEVEFDAGPDWENVSASFDAMIGVEVTVSGMPGIELASRELPLELKGASQRMLPIRIRALPKAGDHGSQTIEFRVTATAIGEPTQTPVTIIETARFIVP